MQNMQEPPKAAMEQDLDPGARRIEEMRLRRKLRGDMDVSGYSEKLSVPKEKKDPRWTYRWVLDTANRVHDLTARDWEKAPPETTAGDSRDMGAGTVIERMGNSRTTPTPERVILMRKPREFYEEDEARKQSRIKEHEQGLRKGVVAGTGPDGQTGLSGLGAYIPEGTGISIKHGQ